MKKVMPHPSYPPEEGRYLRGNDSSPAAVAVVLNCDADKIPPELEGLVRAGLESGAALSGSVQTPNIGFEKMITNIVANPNIRHLILAGPESAGHRTGEALAALLEYGVDGRQRIMGTEAAHAVLFNLEPQVVERFRQQITLVNLQFEDDPELIRRAVWSCYQEDPVEFRGHTLFDSGAYPGPPLGVKLTLRVTQPWSEPPVGDELAAVKRAQQLMEKLRGKLRKAQGQTHHQRDKSEGGQDEKRLSSWTLRRLNTE